MVLLCYVALLVPVLGFANIYFMRYSLVADHWQAAAMIVPAAGVGALLAAWANWGQPRIAVTAGALALLACLGTFPYQQTRIYKDTETLWTDVLSRNPDSWMAHQNLGNWSANQGRVREAAVQLDATVRLKPDDFSGVQQPGDDARQDRSGRGRHRQLRAGTRDQTGLCARPPEPGLRSKQQGRLLLGTRDADSRTYYLRATQLAPDDVEAHYGLALALMNLNDVPYAVAELQKTVTLAPVSIEAHDALARILATHAPADGGDPNRALSEAQRACELTGYQDGLRLDTLALAYAAGGRFADAVATEEKALRLITGSAPPDLVNQLQAHLNLFRAGQPYRLRVPPAR